VHRLEDEARREEEEQAQNGKRSQTVVGSKGQVLPQCDRQFVGDLDGVEQAFREQLLTELYRHVRQEVNPSGKSEPDQVLHRLVYDGICDL
jgi:hypothetical protein